MKKSEKRLCREFWAWHDANPVAETILERIVLMMHNPVDDRISMQMAFEIYRRDHPSTPHPRNSFAAFYSRIFILYHPELAGKIVVKKSAADHMFDDEVFDEE
jgi:esterase/lipase superfamily enzyme